MQLLIVSLALISLANCDTGKWQEFRVKYSPIGTGAGETAFWKVERTLKEALDAGWVLVDTKNDLKATTLCRTTNDVRVCPLYDSNGFVAGMQLAIPPSDVDNENIPYDFNRFPVYEKKTINGDMYWTSTYYLVDPNVISAGGRDRVGSTIGTGLWLKSGTTYIEVPTDEESIKANTPYTWQNCIPNMGKHYYYNMTTNLSCEDTQPYFLLVQDGNIVGLGWQFFGKTQYVDYNWYDTINSMGVKTTVPLSPNCLAEGADIYGVISIHMYLIEKPWEIPCNQSTDSVVPIPGLP